MKKRYSIASACLAMTIAAALAASLIGCGDRKSVV